MNRQADYKQTHDKSPQIREFEISQEVMVRNYREGERWKIGNILKRLGPLTYNIDMGNDIWKHHVDEIKAFQGTSIREDKQKEACVEDMIPADQEVDADLVPTGTTQIQEEEYQENSDSECRYPLRERRPPDRYS